MIAALALALALPIGMEEPRFGVSLGYTAVGPTYGLVVEGVEAGWVGRLAVDERSFELAGGARRQAWGVRGSVARRLVAGPAWLDLGAGWRGRGLIDLRQVANQRDPATTITVPNGPELALAAGVTGWETLLGKQPLRLGLEAEAGYAPFVFAGGTGLRYGALGVLELGAGRLRLGWLHDELEQAFDGPMLLLDFR
jgi:hypothetical protein